MIRANTNLSLKERKVYTFDNFKGVDFTTSPYYVSKNRASYAENLIYENGIVRNRNGYKTLCKILDDNDKPLKINGLFNFTIENQNFLLCYADTKFYLLNYDKDLDKYSKQDITPQNTDLISARISLYINKNKAYIIGCGDYLMFGTWNNKDFEIRRVFNNEDTFIPTTTINIDNDSVKDESRSSFESVNLLTNFRKNKFLGVDTEKATWTVDTKEIKNNTIVKINLELMEGETLVTKEITNSTVNYETLFCNDENVGTINFEKGKITLNINTKPPITNESNITITFQYGEENIFIKNAKLSVLFGGSGNSNRLFLSDGSNKHIWSEMYDFTYFPDINYDVIGIDNSKITGYVKASDGTLLVFKEKNGSDSTIYYVTGTDSTKYDSNNNPIFETNFYRKAGVSSDTVVNNFATANLNGDNLILTVNGVKAVVIKENISINEYNIQTRSRNIDKKLLQHENLKNSVGFVFKDKYYLSIDGVVYICDSKFKFQTQDDIGNSFNYEWWYLTNIDATVFCEINNELYFGTNSGQICKFTKGFEDIDYQDFKEGNITKNKIYSNGWQLSEFISNQEFLNELNEQDRIFVNSPIYDLFLNKDEIIFENNKLILNIEKIKERYNFYGNFKQNYNENEWLYNFYDGIKCFVDNIDEECGLELNEEYVFSDFDLDNYSFKLKKLNKEKNELEEVLLKNIGFRLSRKIDKKILYITDISNCDKSFKLKEFSDSNVLNIIDYNEQSPALNFTIYYIKNIVARWYTAITDFNTNMYSKTLLNITITTEPISKSKLKIGFQTDNKELLINSHSNGAGFNFNDINFNDFNFENSFIKSNTIKVKERNFNFISFRYISDTNKDVAVNSITVMYKINRINKGVR